MSLPDGSSSRTDYQLRQNGALTNGTVPRPSENTKLAERVKQLEAENLQLRQLLQAHGIAIPTFKRANGVPGSPAAVRKDNEPREREINWAPSSSSPAEGNACETSKNEVPTSPLEAAAMVIAASKEASASLSSPVASSNVSPPTSLTDGDSAGEDEADLAPKEAATAIIDAFQQSSPKLTTGTAVTPNVVSALTTMPAPTTTPAAAPAAAAVVLVPASVPPVRASATPKVVDTQEKAPASKEHSCASSTSSTTDSAFSETARLQIQLLYNNPKEQLTITVMKATDLAAFGVLDFSKIVFKADLVPGRLVSSKSPGVVYSHNLPLNVSLSVSVRQTSFKWKKLQISVWSVTDSTSELCLGKAHTSLLDFYNNPEPGVTEQWLNINAECEDNVFSDRQRSGLSSTSTSVSTLPKDTMRSLGFTRRHTATGAEMSTAISQAKELLQAGLSSAPHRSSLASTPTSTPAAAPSQPSERRQQHHRMGSAVMQAARDEARRRTGTGSPSPSTSSLSSTSSTEQDDATQPKTTVVAAPVDVPDVRALNRSRAGDTSLPRATALGRRASDSAPVTPQQPASGSKSTFAASPAASAAQPSPVMPAAETQPPRPSLASLGRAASLDSISPEWRRTSSSTTEGLRKVIAQNKAAKEVLAALDKEEEEKAVPEKKDDETQGEEGDGEESQFVRRASFRLKELRNSQRRKPDRLSFRQKQAFFGTASVDIPDGPKSKK